MLITFGTPHRGSLNAVDFLVNGFVKKLGPLKLADLSQLLRSLTSVYQLLPIYPCVDVGDGTSASPRWICRTSTRRGRRPPCRTSTVPSRPARRPTTSASTPSTRWSGSPRRKQSGRLDGDRLVLVEQYDGDDMGGDGTVPRVSSTPIETDDLQPAYQPMYSSEKHGSLQLAEAVQTQLRGILTARPLSGFRAVQGVRVEADDLLATGESLSCGRCRTPAG